MKIEIKCIITGDDEEILQEFTVVEFTAEQVIGPSPLATDPEQN